MQTSFRRWLEQTHPEFEIDEGLLQTLANPVIKGSNAAIGAMGILGRMYTPFLAMGGGAPVDQPPPQHIVNPPAMVAKAEPTPPRFGQVTMQGNKKIANLTGSKTIDTLGSTVGEPMNQAWWDAADWIPGHMPGGDIDQRDQEIALSNRVQNQAVAMGPKDPPGSPDPTVPQQPRMTPRMRAQMRAKARRHQGV